MLRTRRVNLLAVDSEGMLKPIVYREHLFLGLSVDAFLIILCTKGLESVLWTRA